LKREVGLERYWFGPLLTKSLGMLLLGIWLIATGLIPLLNLSFSGLGIIMAILAPLPVF
jgi:hypothetical protein